MPPESTSARVDRTLRSALAGAGKTLSLRDKRGREAAKELLSLLQEADRQLSRRLRARARDVGSIKRFTGASMISYRAQIRLVTEFVNLRVLGMTNREALHAIRVSQAATVELLEKLERQFTGISRTLNVRQASVMSAIRRGTRSSLLAQHATSVDRYGRVMIAQFERMMQVGLLGGYSNEDMVGILTGHGGPRGKVSLAARVMPGGRVIRVVEREIPEGLFVRYRFWAERIVRTERAHAYEESKLQTLREARRLDMSDLQKKILATFDNRTAPDSIAVHGQIRDLDDYFVDGAGRRYFRPPARPNDREAVIPWRAEWKESAVSRPKTAQEVAGAIRDSLPGGAERRRQSAQQRANARSEQAKIQSRERIQNRMRRDVERVMRDLE